MKIALVSAFAALAASGLVDAQQAVGSGSCTQCVTGFTNEVPRAIWMGNQCNQYNPKKIDWLAFRDVCPHVKLKHVMITITVPH